MADKTDECMAFHCCLEVCSYLGTAVLEGCSLADTVVQEEDCIPLFSMKIDMAMAAAMTKKAMKDGSGSVQKAAQQRHILACSCEFATIR